MLRHGRPPSPARHGIQSRATARARRWRAASRWALLLPLLPLAAIAQPPARLSFASFEEARPELSRLMECRDWLKLDTSVLETTDLGIESLPIARLRPRKIPGVSARDFSGNEHGTIGGVRYKFTQAITVHGYAVKEMSLVAGEGQVSQVTTLAAPALRPVADKVAQALGVSLTPMHDDPDILGAAKGRLYVSVRKATAGVDLACGTQ